MVQSKEILGDYNLISEDLPSEANLYVKVNPIEMITSWRRCGAISNLVGKYFNTNSRNKEENIISTIFNELIENACKYSTKRDSVIEIDVKQYNTVLKFQVQNECEEVHYKSIKKRLSQLLSVGDLNDLFIHEMMEKSSADTTSGIGLLILLKDYDVKIGAGFISKENRKYSVNIQVYYNMEDK
ncbi:MAG: GHKL domain-containing protein [Bacteroidales bacterium]|nr:GHKL domain-containing protein [Bacteroidales bacterium]